MTTPDRVRIGLVLSCGGLRGAAHLGVLRQLIRHRISVDVVVGASAGAIIAAYYAAVGLTVEEMIGDAPRFLGRHIIMHGLTLRAHPRMKPLLRRFCGVIPRRLAQLEQAHFGQLHHGIAQIGIVCHDTIRNRPFYFSTDRHHGARLSEIAKASAAFPGAMPARLVTVGGQDYRFIDGGISDSLPIGFARAPGMDATHLIVSDCRFRATPASGENLVYIRPDMDGMRSFRAPRATLMEAVRAGEAAMTDSVMNQIRAWLPRLSPALA
jgi:NTE family protein